jgi:uncharacterized membrane protein
MATDPNTPAPGSSQPSATGSQPSAAGSAQPPAAASAQAPATTTSTQAVASTRPPGPSHVYSILLFAFQGSRTAGGLVDDVVSSQRRAGLKIITQAVVERELDGNVKIHEPGRGGVGATAGAVAGGLLALLGGPVGVLTMVVAGGAIGGVAGHFAGRVLPADDLRRIGQSLPVNSSGFIVITEDTEAEKAIDAMKQFTADVVVITAGSELSGVIGQAIAADIEPLPGAAPPAAASSPAGQPAQPQSGQQAKDAPKSS